MRLIDLVKVPNSAKEVSKANGLLTEAKVLSPSSYLLRLGKITQIFNYNLKKMNM